MTDLTGLAIRQTWQIATLVVMVWVATSLIGDKRQHMKYLLWLLVFLKCLTPPLICTHVGVFCWIAHSREQSSDAQFVSTSHEKFGDDSLRAESDSSADAVGSNDDEKTGGLEQASIRSSATRARGIAVPCLLSVWWYGILLTSLVAVVRTMYFFGRICERSSDDYESVQDLVCRLSQRFSLRRHVRVWVTRAHVGPAVYGLLRPTIVIPESLLLKLTADELEPILAHELLHIRRGDLWVNLLQSVSKSMWWFNPLVWVASRRINDLAECCCDEQTVAALECDPRVYAKSLLRVLEMKHCLFSTPSFPGVRPVEITAQRMERIMDLGHGCQKRTPNWCWSVLLVLALLFVPGGSVMLAETPENEGEIQELDDLVPAGLGSSSNPPLERDDTSNGVEDVLTSFDHEFQVESMDQVSRLTSFWRLTEHECLQIALKNSGTTNCTHGDSLLDISRKTTDLSPLEWEESVVELTNAVLRSYWELRFFYDSLATSKEGRDGALSKWKKALDEELAAEQVAQAKEQYYFFQNRFRQGQKDLFKVEARLRYLIGVAEFDGRLIVPVSKCERLKAELDDWEELLDGTIEDSLAVRRSRWQLARRELELQAAKGLLKPHFDSQAAWKKFLEDATGIPASLPLDLSVGMRRELAQLRSSSLALIREKSKVEEVEQQIEYQLKETAGELKADWRSTQTVHSRLVAAQEQVEAVSKAFGVALVPLDLLLDADRRLADAGVANSKAGINLKLSRIELHRLKGSLLNEYAIRIEENVDSK